MRPSRTANVTVPHATAAQRTAKWLKYISKLPTIPINPWLSLSLSQQGGDAALLRRTTDMLVPAARLSG